MSLVKDLYSEEINRSYTIRDFEREQIEQRMNELRETVDPDQLELYAIQTLVECEQEHEPQF